MIINGHQRLIGATNSLEFGFQSFADDVCLYNNIDTVAVVLYVLPVS